MKAKQLSGGGPGSWSAPAAIRLVIMDDVKGHLEVYEGLHLADVVITGPGTIDVLYTFDWEVPKLLIEMVKGGIEKVAQDVAIKAGYPDTKITAITVLRMHSVRYQLRLLHKLTCGRVEET